MASDRSIGWWLRRTMTVLSLGCFVGCALLGIRSFWRVDSVTCATRYAGDVFLFSTRSVRGTVRFRFERAPGVIFAPSAVPREGLSVRFGSDPSGTRPPYPAALWQFALEHDDAGLKTPGNGVIRVEFPLWVAAALFGIPPLYTRLRRRPTQESGVCAVCGYDLRATPDRCPECGIAVGSMLLRGPS
jgi:hypothetical protein